MEGLKSKVKAILEKLNIDNVDNGPIPVKEVADIFSLPVVSYPHFPDSISGTIIQNNEINVIGVNANQANVRQRFTIAHELGHYLLGHDHAKVIDETFDSPNRNEQEANKFAAELLMPEHFLKKDVENGLVDVPTLATRYLVSEQAMSIRLLETGLINYIK